MLDETALLLELDDVYWTEEGVLSVQIAFAAIAMLSALAYLIRMLRHGEAAGLRDRLGAGREGVGRPADELRRGPRDRHLTQRVAEVAHDQLAAAGAPLTKPKNGPKSCVAVKPGRYRPVEARLHRVVEHREAVAGRRSNARRYGTRARSAL